MVLSQGSTEGWRWRGLLSLCTHLQHPMLTCANTINFVSRGEQAFVASLCMCYGRMSTHLTFLRPVRVANGPGDLHVFYLRWGKSSLSYSILTLQLDPNHLEDPRPPSCPLTYSRGWKGHKDGNRAGGRDGEGNNTWGVQTCCELGKDGFKREISLKERLSFHVSQVLSKKQKEGGALCGGKATDFTVLKQQLLPCL